MNRLLIIGSFLFFSLTSLAQKDILPIDSIQIDFDQMMQNYIVNPEPTDTLCISDIYRAKKDVANGKIVFTQNFGFLFGFIRYESELMNLCKDYGLVFENELIIDIIFEGQTQGCYSAYMDKVIADKFGSNFKDKLHKTADSLFLYNAIKTNRAIKYLDCDVRPRLPFEKERTTDNLPTIIVKSIDIEVNKGQHGGSPFFDLGFIVEIDSTISGFYINRFIPVLEINKKYESELFDIAVNYINNNYPKWVPGKIDGQMVRTDNNVRIHFSKE